MIREKEESLVLAKGSAERSSVHVASHLRTAFADCFKIGVIGVECLVAKVFVDASMQEVAAALGYDLHAAARAGDRRIIQRGPRVHFADALWRRNRNVCEVVPGNIVGINTIDLITVLRYPRAIYGDVW